MSKKFELPGRATILREWRILIPLKQPDFSLKSLPTNSKKPNFIGLFTNHSEKVLIYGIYKVPFVFNQFQVVSAAPCSMDAA
jgi:hypothetical protein